MSALLNGFIAWIEQAVVWVVNQVIASIGALVATMVGLLPPMPSFPSLGLPSSVQTWFDFGSYWFPVGFLLTTVGVVFAIWGVWLVVAIPLRWAKAVPGGD